VAAVNVDETTVFIAIVDVSCEDAVVVVAEFVLVEPINPLVVVVDGGADAAVVVFAIDES
jgi:hypothetical protein